MSAFPCRVWGTRRKSVTLPKPSNPKKQKKCSVFYITSLFFVINFQVFRAALVLDLRDPNSILVRNISCPICDISCPQSLQENFGMMPFPFEFLPFLYPVVILLYKATLSKSVFPNLFIHDTKFEMAFYLPYETTVAVDVTLWTCTGQVLGSNISWDIGILFLGFTLPTSKYRDNTSVRSWQLPS
jgi:hypothetical protein